MNNKYRAVLVGLGNIAWRFDQNLKSSPGLTHASALIKDHRTELAGGFSPDRADRSAFEKALNIPAYDNFEKMLFDLEPDIVSICSPHEYHYSQTLECIEKSVPMIWLEKPPAGSLLELDGLIRKLEEKENPSCVLVNFLRRYMDSYRGMRSIFEAQTFGRCRSIHINYSRGLENNGIHMLDLIFFIMKDESRYRVERWKTLSNGENPSFLVSFESGIDVFVTGQDLSYHNIDFCMTFDSGRVSVLYGGMTMRIEKKIEHELFPGFYRLKEEDGSIPESGGTEKSMSEALNDLIISHQTGKLPDSSLQSARLAQALLNEVRMHAERA